MKRTYKDEAEVVALIDRYKAEMEKTLIKIENTNHLADMLRTTVEAHRIAGLRNDAESMQREIEWRVGRIETLGEILAELMTAELPFDRKAEVDP